MKNVTPPKDYEENKTTPGKLINSHSPDFNFILFRYALATINCQENAFQNSETSEKRRARRRDKTLRSRFETSNDVKA